MPRTATPPDIITVPWTIIVDSNEGAPWQFRSLTDDNNTPIVVKLAKAALWTRGLADYSIQGHEEHFQIERKSIEDLFGTLGGRRDHFEAEIERLHDRCDRAYVIVEGNRRMIDSWSGHGPNPKSVTGTIEAWGLRYPKVRWLLCPSRTEAERKAFRLMEKFMWDVERGKAMFQREGT